MVKLIKELNSDVYEDWIRLIISMSDPNRRELLEKKKLAVPLFYILT